MLERGGVVGGLVEAVFEVEDVDVGVRVGCESLDGSAGRSLCDSGSARSDDLSMIPSQGPGGVWRHYKLEWPVPSLGEVCGLLI
jgi:hypothetical protein